MNDDDEHELDDDHGIGLLGLDDHDEYDDGRPGARPGTGPAPARGPAPMGRPDRPGDFEASPRRGVRRGFRGLIVFLLGLGLLAGLGVLAVNALPSVLHRNSAAPDYPGPGTGDVVVAVERGQTLTDIGGTLQTAGVVKSVGAFTQAADGESRALGIQPGSYRLHHRMKGSAALALLLDPAARLKTTVVVPPGLPVRDIVTRIAAQSQIPLAEVRAALATPAKLGLPAYCNGQLEGCLFPATYEAPPGTTAVDLLSRMVTRFKQAAATVGLEAGAARLGLSGYDVLRIASIVQRESGAEADDPKIARVFYNRMRDGMELGSDATLYYVLGFNHGQLTASDLKLNSPYNTRLRAGLPPTPICSPDEAALRAAANPAAGPWLYFVTVDKAGHAAFAVTYADHQRNIALAHRNGVQ